MKTKTEKHLNELVERFTDLEVCRGAIRDACELLLTCYRGGGKVLVCGNGGSGADAEHIVGELMNKLRLNRHIPPADRERIRTVAESEQEAEYLSANLQRGLPAICLSSHSALVSAIANDMAADMIFAQQVYGYGCAGDVLWAISTSGNSGNILNAIKVARAVGVKVLGMTGGTGGAMARRSDVLLCVPESVTYRVQELHLPVYHTLCSMIEEELFGQ
jgi:D-sedoheptulose 7-phosphate isomerase